MIPLFGSRKVLCDGLSRRDLLHVGGLGLFGVGLGDAFHLREVQAESAERLPQFGKAKACILLFLFGSPGQHETFDPKVDAPAEIQGELKAIPTRVPSLKIGEGFPRIADVMDRVTTVRSLTHPYPIHGLAYALSGVPTTEIPLEVTPRDRRHWPFIGSVVDYLGEQRTGTAPPEIPRNIAMPWLFYSKSEYPPISGPYAGFLGTQYDPVWTEFEGAGTRFVPNCITGTESSPKFFDPYGGIEPDAKLELAGPAGRLNDGVSRGRVDRRRSLLAQFDASRRWLDRDVAVDSYSQHQQMAYSLLASNRVRQALDVAREPARVRERFGMTLFGQATLAARRLVEAGSQFVTVFWDAYGHFGNGWDTHVWQYPRLRQYLMPGLDQTYSALILDLESRGLLDETLVLCISEHGRTPQINNRPGGGREHWSRAYSGLLAGGGIASGKVVGRTDAHGGEVADTPVSPKDVLATSFHLLGIDPQTVVYDRQNRPYHVAG